jgi:hypothetical protein
VRQRCRSSRTRCKPISSRTPRDDVVIAR